MNQTPNESGKTPMSIQAMAFTPVLVGGEVGCLTLLIVIIALIAGLGLDKLLNTKPLFTIALLLGSAPFSLGLTFWVATRSIKRMTGNQIQGTGQAQMGEEEENSE
jgi:hypothetical protein